MPLVSSFQLLDRPCSRRCIPSSVETMPRNLAPVTVGLTLDPLLRGLLVWFPVDVSPTTALKRQVRELACRALSEPESSALDCVAESHPPVQGS